MRLLSFSVFEVFDLTATNNFPEVPIVSFSFTTN